MVFLTQSFTLATNYLISMITTTIAIAEHNLFYREEICCLLKDNHCSVTLLTTSLQHLLNQFNETLPYPNVCLFNLHLLEKEGSSFTGEIKKQSPRTNLLGYYIDESQTYSILRSGLDAILPLNNQLDEFVDTIQYVIGLNAVNTLFG